MSLAFGLFCEPFHIPGGRFEVAMREGHMGMPDPNQSRPSRGPEPRPPPQHPSQAPTEPTSSATKH
jgi:hypothetical protein